MRKVSKIKMEKMMQKMIKNDEKRWKIMKKNEIDEDENHRQNNYLKK